MEHDVVPFVPARRPSAWRRTIGALLRAAREDDGLRLVDVAARARLSPQYLSEVERGLKEPSSEVLAALADALGLTLSELAQGLVDALDAPPARGAASGGTGPVVRSLSSRAARAHAAPAPAPAPRARVLLAA